ELFQKMDEYLDYLGKKNARIPDGYAEVQREAEAVRAALNTHPAKLVPCHCDPLAENFLDTGQRIFIIDWEYAGNNDPMWDLGDVSVEAGFEPEQDAALMTAYFDGHPPAAQVGRMVMYKAMCDLLWTLWGVIQVVNENPVDDFWAYATNRFERCKSLMAQADFRRHLEAVRQG
ncbi:MAG: phosphotransferase family protein, partial [Dongiaceae bacterium]